LKILEALACATPVVSTRVGAEGLHLDAGRHLNVVEDPAELPAALLRTLRDPVAARCQAESGRERVLARYGWDRLADHLETVWLRYAGNRFFDLKPAPQTRRFA
jgi:glycosyltransferase involved in cell wall biosynthesis